MADYDEPFIAPDGVKCPRTISRTFGIVDKNQEVFQMDESYTKLSDPKFVKFRDGHKEKYNPSKHRGGKGKSFDESKMETGVRLPPNGRAGQKIYKGGIWWGWNDDTKEWKEEE